MAYCSKVCLQICCHLNIYLFKIIPPSASTTTKSQVSRNNDNNSNSSGAAAKLGVTTRSSANKH